MNGLNTALSKTRTLILAGGQGERLGALTASCPKPAVSFGGMFRIIDFTLSNCLHSGLEHVSLLTQYRHEDLHDYVREGWGRLWNDLSNRETSLVCLPPASGKRYRGTADAVYQNLSLLEAETAEYVIVLSGDHIYQMDYRELLAQHIATNADLTIAAIPYPVKDASHFGILETLSNSRVVGFEEKPAQPRPLPSDPEMALVSMGVYVFTASALKRALQSHCGEGAGTDFGKHIIPSLISSGRVFSHEFRDRQSKAPRYWRDIGTIDSYYSANMDLLHPDAPFDPFANESNPAHPTRHPGPTGIRPLPALIDGRARVERSVISHGAYVGEGAHIEDSILMPGVRVGKGVRLRRVIVAENAEIPAGFHAGIDLNHDRAHHRVTESGLVLVANTRHAAKPAGLRIRKPIHQSPLASATA